ncbi:Tetratricopeptide repeat protein 5 [Gryllus bimaculatus]|nr:Tetratricopeptide repeat protein 5 [Gryllus bimaculatus]
MSTDTSVPKCEETILSAPNAIDVLTEKVKSLYVYRDHYFEKHSLDSAKHKHTDVENELKNTLNIFDDLKETGCKTNRAMYYYLKGRALNVTPNYNIQAEDVLSKAVKLDPKLVDAWNELGECYWKKDDIDGARNCFAGALKHAKNKVSLRNLSIVLRQVKTKSFKDHVNNIEEGVSCAKEAVQLDTNDGVSWAVLGNAYLSSFFSVAQNPKILKLCMSAYLQAEKDPVAQGNPDLHYNKAVALKYEEEYELALESFKKAISLDPTWEVPKQKQAELLKYLDHVQDLIKNKGKVKAKKLHQMIQSLDTKQLGPYGGGSYTSPKGLSVKLEPIPLDNLQRGLNVEKVVLGKVVCSFQDENNVPFTFCMVDKQEKCIAVTVYNLAQGKGVIIGDSVAIPEPYVSHEYAFNSIRVDSPVVMVVNGKKIGIDQQVGVQLYTFKKVD